MYPELQALIHEAEYSYLGSDDLESLSAHIATLAEKINGYKKLRDEELNIFQEVADKLEAKFPEENTQVLENSLQHWLLITRYCGMAMLLNNPEFLERRLLEWLTDIVQVRQSQAIDEAVRSLLVVGLNKLLSEQEVAYLLPFLDQAKDYLTRDSVAV